MPETITLTDHDAIRDWAAARAGQPAMSDPPTGLEQTEPVLRIVFGQQPYQDHDEGADRPGGVTIVDWDEWFQTFDERQLALVVHADVPGQREQFHELIRR